MTRGMLYLAKGPTFRTEATRSAEQLASVMPETPVSVVTDGGIDEEPFDEVIRDPTGFELSDKPWALQQSPYERTVFLDTDTYVDRDLSGLFDLLDRFELAVRRNRDQSHVPPPSKTDVPEAFPEFNSGVIAYRQTRAVRELLRTWEQRCRPEHGFDQRSFRTALYRSSVRFTPLPNRYNCMYQYDNVVDGEVRVFHGPLVERDREQNGVDSEEARAKLNESGAFRFHRTYRGSLLVNPPLPVATKLRSIYRQRGARATVSAVLQRLTAPLG